MTEVFELDPKSKSFNMAESACCIAFPDTERIGLSSPFFLQIDTFGKLLRQDYSDKLLRQMSVI